MKLKNALTIFSFSLLLFSTPSMAIQKSRIQLGHKLHSFGDPNVAFDPYKKTYYLTGTAGNKIPFYSSKNGVNFKPYKSFNPSALDPIYNYCYIWAPDLVRLKNGSYHLLFSASRYKKKGGKCDIHSVTTFKTTASGSSFKFHKPQPLNYVAKTFPYRGCHKGYNKYNCERTMRIDSNLFVDPDNGNQRLFYNWFYNGNNISSFSYNSKSSAVQTNTYPTHAFEEKITEAPDVFKRGAYYYLIFSRGFFNKSYGLSYIYSKSLSGLSKSNNKVHHLFDPTFDYKIKGCASHNGRKVLSSGGHSSTIKVGNNYYIYYHLNRFGSLKNNCHKYLGRDVFRSKLEFQFNGQIVPFNKKLFRWNNLGKGYKYSLDVKLKSGEIIPACLHAGILNERKEILFTNKCAKQGVNLNTIHSTRICSSFNGQWKKSAVCGKFKTIPTGSIQYMYVPRPK